MITLYALRLAVALARLAPPRLAYAACEALGRAFWVLGRSARSAIESNQRRALGADAPGRRVRRATRDVFVHITKDYYDLASLGRGAAPAPVEVVGLEHLDAAAAAGRGAVMVFFHMAGFNLTFRTPVLDTYEIAVVTEPLRPPALARLTDRLRAELGVRLIPADGRALLTVFRELRANRVVALAADRSVTGVGEPTTLFGEPANLPVTAAAAIARRARAPLVPMRIHRISDNRVCIDLAPPVGAVAPGEPPPEAREMAREVVRVFEQHLSRYPGQWVMSQPVWRDAGPEPP